jgi:hypothetical protein
MHQVVTTRGFVTFLQLSELELKKCYANQNYFREYHTTGIRVPDMVDWYENVLESHSSSTVPGVSDVFCILRMTEYNCTEYGYFSTPVHCTLLLHW